MNDIKPHPNDELYLNILRRMTPEQKLNKVMELNNMGRDLLRAGIRQQYPQSSETEIDHLVLKRLMECHNRNY
jgi:hypothetical protein